ncbi:response regulator [Faunimonas sp. B44]|uniref:response regulator n=1 Tax=Faunimonas sp. B44 TaxID=3461493 RepID=UPI00404517AD
MQQRGVRVLYVDDDAGIARLVQKSLERRGYLVETAPDGLQAMARVREGGVDVIGLDHHMPRLSGLDFLKELQAIADPPPVVYVTGSGDTRVAVAALKAGAADYVIKDVQGDFLELLGAAIDGALHQAQLRRERDAAERAVREARDRAEMLLREVNHRVGNSLALVAALVRMQSSAVRDPAAAEALKETQARISAIAGIHRRLYTSDDVRFVDAGSYLRHLVEELEAAMRDSGRPHAIRTEIENVPVPTDKAVSMGVVVTELVTNAYKYAYPEGEAGEIRVRLTRPDPDSVCLVVEDDGVGLNGSAQPRGTGLGSRIVDAMAVNLRSQVEVDPAHSGTRVMITFGL